MNRGKNFSKKEIVKKSRVSLPMAGREIRLLSSVGFIKKRSSSSLVWSFNSSFKYGEEFKNLFLNSETISKNAVLENFRKVGRIKFLALSGVFIRNDDSRVDLLLVGDKLKIKNVEEGVRRLEAELGVELAYVTFDTKEFLYRVKMYDKLVRDILDFPHEIAYQAKELSTQVLKKA